MIRAWLALALVSASWTAGLGCYRPASAWLWAASLAAGVVLWATNKGTVPFSLNENWDSPQGECLVAAAIWILPVWVMPWPYRAAPLLLLAGLLLHWTPIPRRWPRALAGGASMAGWTLLAQAPVAWAYGCWTARSHELPSPLAHLMGVVARALGVEASVEGSTLAIRAGDDVHRLGATWDLLIDPATLLFAAGGLAMLGLVFRDAPPRRRLSDWGRAAGTLLLVVAAWLPVRLGMILGLYVHRVARADASLPPSVMNQTFSWWLPAMLLAGPTLLAVRLVSVPPVESRVEPPAAGRAFPRRRLALCCGLVALGAAVPTWLWAWHPVGSPREGRVTFVERHSEWEPTDAAYDEDHYGEPSSYTYRVLYDYASRFFSMSRLVESDAIDAETLRGCDVLVVKTPTARFLPEEVAAIAQYVRNGGGLLLIGDHTNVFNSTAYINDVARQFGFAFRDDLLFCVGTPYEQAYRPALVPHPAVQYVERMDFAVSCSIDPGRSSGRAALWDIGLWSLPSQYEHENYHPPAEYRATLRAGAFIQLWAARHGAGRVLAFTDSTIFSNFSLFQPGKSELAIGMLDWLNRRSYWDEPGRWRLLTIPLGLAGAALAAFGLWTARGSRAGALLAACFLAGWAAACLGAGASARAAMPAPVPRRDAVDVAIDRTVSDAPLSKGAYIQGQGEGFGLFEQWIPRLGCFTSRRAGADAFAGDALVVLHPTGSVSEEYRRRLVEYVARGGRVLVVDSPGNYRSTANSLLWPFGLAIEPEQYVRGEVVLADSTLRLPDEVGCAVSGGSAVARIGNTTVAATTSLGKGRVTAIGFGPSFDDYRMGGSWQPQPDAAQRGRYDVLFALLRAALVL